MVLIGTRSAPAMDMRLSRIIPSALLLGLGGWAVTRFIRKAGSASAEPEEQDDDLGEPVLEVLIIDEDVLELH
jgi:putative Mn2+ efflux pump MntP